MRLLGVWEDEYFNSQPHEEADTAEKEPVPAAGISTHSLTKRLTKTALNTGQKTYISTHSLTKRLTEPIRNWSYCAVFQLTASRRG